MTGNFGKRKKSSRWKLCSELAYKTFETWRFFVCLMWLNYFRAWTKLSTSNQMTELRHCKETIKLDPILPSKVYLLLLFYYISKKETQKSSFVPSLLMQLFYHWRAVCNFQLHSTSFARELMVMQPAPHGSHCILMLQQPLVFASDRVTPNFLASPTELRKNEPVPSP